MRQKPNLSLGSSKGRERREIFAHTLINCAQVCVHTHTLSISTWNVEVTNLNFSWEVTFFAVVVLQVISFLTLIQVVFFHLNQPIVSSSWNIRLEMRKLILFLSWFENQSSWDDYLHTLKVLSEMLCAIAGELTGTTTTTTTTARPPPRSLCTTTSLKPCK